MNHGLLIYLAQVLILDPLPDITLPDFSPGFGLSALACATSVAFLNRFGI